MSDLIMLHQPHPTLIDKSMMLGAWVMAGALFLTVGWIAMEPDDPLGPVSMLTRSGSVGMLIQVLGLAGAAAAVATVMVGRRVPEAGMFAASIGLVAVSLRGSTTAHFLLAFADQPGRAQQMLALKLAGESLLWFFVILFAVFVSMQVGRWLFRSDRRGSISWTGTSSRREGLRHTITTLVIGLLVMSVLWAGSNERSIQHGQVCFVIAFSVATGVYVSFRRGAVDSPVWHLLAIPAMAVIGYLWAALSPETLGVPPNLPASHFLRPLPIQYISVGTAAAVLTFWYARRRGMGVPHRDEPHR